MLFEEAKKLINKELLENLYTNKLYSVLECAKELNVSVNMIKLLIKEYNLTRDDHLFRQRINKISGSKEFEKIKEKITKDFLHQYYIIEDHGYSETIEKLGISEWIFDKLLKEYNIYKDRKQTTKKSVKTRYEKAGGKDNYLNQVKEKSKETKIKNFGSLDNYKSYISSKSSEAWSNMSLEKKHEIQERVKSHGGGWNKETSLRTLQEKYGVDNAYKLAKDFQTNSKVNKAFADILDRVNISYSREFLLDNYRYDFKINNTLIEINPWPFHNSSWSPIAEVQPKDKNYHLEKTKKAFENDYNCIHIWDWDDIDKIIFLLSNKQVVFARKCKIREINRLEAKDFLNKYHLQGYARDKIRIGLFYENQLISLMTFGKPRYNKNYEWELIRYCSSKAVIGGGKKLFNYFIKNYNPNSIISYCDISKFSGKIYNELGFKLVRNSQPAKHWYNINTKQHITDNLLRQQGFDRLLGEQYGYFGKGSNNEELMLNNKFVEIYDCGQNVFEWVKITR